MPAFDITTVGNNGATTFEYFWPSWQMARTRQALWKFCQVLANHSALSCGHHQQFVSCKVEVTHGESLRMQSSRTKSMHACQSACSHAEQVSGFQVMYGEVVHLKWVNRSRELFQTSMTSYDLMLKSFLATRTRSSIPFCLSSSI